MHFPKIVVALMSVLLRRVFSSKTVARVGSVWESIPLAPADKILGLTWSYKADKNPNKANLGVGAYRNDEGLPVVLNSIRRAEEAVLAMKLDHEYADIAGLKAYVDLAVRFAYGETCSLISENRIAAVQSLSGTGALRVMGEFIAKFKGRGTKIYLPNPTWGNHQAVFLNAGLQPVNYRYFNANTSSLDFDGLVEDLNAADPGSFILLHACAHNPTGTDPTVEQWDILSRVIMEKGHFVFFDSAYQGFASGDPEKDAYAIRKFVADGHRIALAQSFSKNFGMYGERIGSLSIVTGSAEETERVVSQLKLIIRPMYSNPPLYGAWLVSTVLGTPDLKEQWKQDVSDMANRIMSMRVLLRGKLEALQTEKVADPSQHRSWSHITDQIGMFCFSGLTTSQVLRLRSEFHIYCTDDGRFSMAGVNSHNVDYIARSMHSCIFEGESVSSKSEL